MTLADLVVISALATAILVIVAVVVPATMIMMAGMSMAPRAQSYL